MRLESRSLRGGWNLFRVCFVYQTAKQKPLTVSRRRGDWLALLRRNKKDGLLRNARAASKRYNLQL
jgi:hypothetical protein